MEKKKSRRDPLTGQKGKEPTLAHARPAASAAAAMAGEASSSR
jgi:hypothetical protein